SVSLETPPTSIKTLRRNAPIAPGTVGVHCRTSYIRRSRLNPITYSMCCQRPSRPRRLPTFVFPDTAPTAGSASGRTRLPTVSGSRAANLGPRKRRHGHDTSGDEDADREDDPAQRAGQPERQLDGPQEHDATRAIERRGDWLDLGTREAEHGSQGHERVALGA